MTQLTSQCFVPCALPSQRTLSDNSTTHFVLRGAQEGRDFSSKARLAADNSSANCHLRVSFVDARPSATAVPAIGCGPSHEKLARTNRNKSPSEKSICRVCPCDPLDSCRSASNQCAERQVPGIQPSSIIDHHSSIIIHRSSFINHHSSFINHQSTISLNPALNPPSPAAPRSADASAAGRPPPGWARGRPC